MTDGRMNETNEEKALSSLWLGFSLSLFFFSLFAAPTSFFVRSKFSLSRH